MRVKVDIKEVVQSHQPSLLFIFVLIVSSHNYYPVHMNFKNTISTSVT